MINEQVNEQEIKNIAEQVLKDPILVQKLSDRIYQLMTEELRNQQERTSKYWRYR